jgi:hypothetical protein
VAFKLAQGARAKLRISSVTVLAISFTATQATLGAANGLRPAGLHLLCDL